MFLLVNKIDKIGQASTTRSTKTGETWKGGVRLMYLRKTATTKYMLCVCVCTMMVHIVIHKKKQGRGVTSWSAAHRQTHNKALFCCSQHIYLSTAPTWRHVCVCQTPGVYVKKHLHTCTKLHTTLSVSLYSHVARYTCPNWRFIHTIMVLSVPQNTTKYMIAVDLQLFQLASHTSPPLTCIHKPHPLELYFHTPHPLEYIFRHVYHMYRIPRPLPCVRDAYAKVHKTYHIRVKIPPSYAHGH